MKALNLCNLHNPLSKNNNNSSRLDTQFIPLIRSIQFIVSACSIQHKGSLIILNSSRQYALQRNYHSILTSETIEQA
ncbi:hypothetical protein EUGRSUZ_C04034 [Eucalyptus grandis]|uniref:Uncharacterized protein n=2 Tax=Eucalyptus grandis TaxID=71139 RepID=A0ACC3LLB0_EUCGR|nr:hypothetical protein EUGRSUZ_C04034 [Eucalyptus grandis]